MFRGIASKKADLLAHKQRILQDIKYYDKRIDEFSNKIPCVYFMADSSDSEDGFPTFLDVGPSISELRKQERLLKTCLKATQELTSVAVLESEVQVLVEDPVIERETPVSEPGLWREVTAECRIDLVPFTICFYVHQPSKRFGAPSFRGLRVRPVKAAQEAELSASVLHSLTSPAEALGCLRGYAEGYRARRGSLARLATSHAACLHMQPKEDGGFLIKCGSILEISWRLENKASAMAPFQHKMNFEIDYMDEDHLKIIKQAHRQLSDPSLKTDARTALLSTIVNTCIDVSQEAVESDSDTTKLEKTILEDDSEQPHMSERDEVVMAPPKFIPKKTKPKGKENSDENRKSVKRSNSNVDGSAKKAKTDGAGKDVSVKTTKTDGSSKDGSVKTTKTDGASKDGSVKTTKTDSASNDASVKKAKTDGAGKDGTVKTTKTNGASKDGSVKTAKTNGASKDGSVKTAKTDGAGKDGTVKTTKTDGAIKDGSVKTTKTNGASKDGSVKTTKTNGASKDGSVKTAKTDGASKDGSVKTAKTDGAAKDGSKKAKADGAAKDNREKRSDDMKATKNKDDRSDINERSARIDVNLEQNCEEVDETEKESNIVAKSKKVTESDNVTTKNVAKKTKVAPQVKSAENSKKVAKTGPEKTNESKDPKRHDAKIKKTDNVERNVPQHSKAKLGKNGENNNDKNKTNPKVKNTEQNVQTNVEASVNSKNSKLHALNKNTANTKTNPAQIVVSEAAKKINANKTVDKTTKKTAISEIAKKPATENSTAKKSVNTKNADIKSSDTTNTKKIVITETAKKNVNSNAKDMNFDKAKHSVNSSITNIAKKSIAKNAIPSKILTKKLNNLEKSKMVIKNHRISGGKVTKKITALKSNSKESNIPLKKLSPAYASVLKQNPIRMSPRMMTKFKSPSDSNIQSKLSKPATNIPRLLKKPAPNSN